MTIPNNFPDGERSWLDRLLMFSLRHKAVVFLVVLVLIGWGLLVSPFSGSFGIPVRDPVPVDAIPDIGENQQIVFTTWAGRSPQDMEDQVTYPLTTALLGIPGVKSIRSFSMFGYASVYVIFEDNMDFYWCRSRILEKINSLTPGTLPDGVQPTLGPDATAMGQVFWYTLEGRDRQGRPTGGWDLDELRSLQDYYVRYALLSVDGVSEVASIGGFVKEYQVDLDPDRMRAYGITLENVLAAVRSANRDVGARTIEVNRVEYLVRGTGFIRNLDDIRRAVIVKRDNVPVFVEQVAHVSLGPALRQGALDKGGNEAVGGVVVVRFGGNPMAVIQAVKKKIEEIAPGLPKRELADGTVSQVRIVPFYDRTELIKETLGTLKSALTNEILVTIMVVVLAVAHLGSALLISAVLPLAVLLCFIAMKNFSVDANIVALSGIAIAIGTLVDMGIILVENILRHLKESGAEGDSFRAVFNGAREVGGAVLTAVATTIVGFLPVFAMEGPEGKLFQPLAWTKTFALFASFITALVVLPPLVHLIFRRTETGGGRRWVWNEVLIYLGVIIGWFVHRDLGLAVAAIGAWRLIVPRLPDRYRKRLEAAGNILLAAGVGYFLTRQWMPLGVSAGWVRNYVFVLILVGGLLGGFRIFYAAYPRILEWCLENRMLFLGIPAFLVFLGILIWQGAPVLMGWWVPAVVRNSSVAERIHDRFPGLGEEFMPPLDEGAFLFMPSTMPHASIGEALDILQRQDRAIETIAEVETAVGKIGRVDSALDPAPLSMIETLITYRPEFLTDSEGNILRFAFDPEISDAVRGVDGKLLKAPDGMTYRVAGGFERDDTNRLIPDPDGHPFRLWRAPLDPVLNPGRNAWPGIRGPEDIWAQIVSVARVPGTTSASMLQPISARMVMLQSGIRASMGIRVMGGDLEAIEKVALRIEHLVREVPGIEPATVIADRVIGKPYLELHPRREIIAQYGITVEDVLEVIEFAIGGRRITSTVEGRERYPVRVRYARELRDDLESVGNVLVPAPGGLQIPMRQLADITYVRGPGVIKGEDTFLVGYVLFDKRPGISQVQAVEAVQRHLEESIEYGMLELPSGVSYAFTGAYENQVRSEKRLLIILPAALVLIFVILYLQFHSFSISAMVFSGVAVAWSGGFILIWLYGQPWFLDWTVFDVSLRELFRVQPVHLSVAVWVGFLALFGIASDDGVVMATYLDKTFSSRKVESVKEIRAATVDACLKRVRPCLMTTATTLLALLPVLTSTGRGADIMVPMAIPSFGGMALEVITMLVVPVLFCSLKEFKLKRGIRDRHLSPSTLREPQLQPGV